MSTEMGSRLYNSQLLYDGGTYCEPEGSMCSFSCFLCVCDLSRRDGRGADVTSPGFCPRGPFPGAGFPRADAQRWDLHNHPAGALYAKSWMEYAAHDNLCVDQSPSNLLAPPCDPAYKYTNKGAVRHFFASLDKFIPAALNSCKLRRTFG